MPNSHFRTNSEGKYYLENRKVDLYGHTAFILKRKIYSKTFQDIFYDSSILSEIKKAFCSDLKTLKNSNKTPESFLPHCEYLKYQFKSEFAVF